jgi:hypothetical protein
VIWALRQQVKQLSDLKAQLSDPGNTPNLLPELLVGITDLLSNLVTGTFIIEKQPPQVRLFLIILLVGINDLLSNLVTWTFIIEKQPAQVSLLPSCWWASTTYLLTWVT